MVTTCHATDLEKTLLKGWEAAKPKRGGSNLTPINEWGGEGGGGAMLNVGLHKRF